MLDFRLAKMEDAKTLFDLKNDKIVRANSIVSHDVIPWDGHLKWLKDRIKSDDTKIWVIEKDGAFAGDVRIENNEISIKLIKEQRGHGIGVQAIRKLSEVGNIAKIVDGNIASMNTFIRCGFKFIEYKDGYYTLQRTI